MKKPFDNPVPPFPGWKRQLVRLGRPTTPDDVRAFLDGQESCTRDTPSGQVHIIHKYGLLELGLIIGESVAEVWSDPAYGAFPQEYRDALLATRF